MLPRLALCVALVWTGGCVASSVPPPPGGGGRRSNGDGVDPQLLSRVVQSRVSGSSDILPTAYSDGDGNETDNSTHPLLKGSQEMLMRTAAWLQKQNPALLLVFASALATHTQNNLGKRSDLSAIRSQVRARVCGVRAPDFFFGRWHFNTNLCALHRLSWARTSTSPSSRRRRCRG